MAQNVDNEKWAGNVILILFLLRKTRIASSYRSLRTTSLSSNTRH